MKDLAPNITRQRLLIEATYAREDLSKANIEKFLRDLPAALDLRIYSEPLVYSPGGEGRADNQGYDGFVALIDSGIAIYVWESSKFLSVVIYTCKAFDDATALAFTADYFQATEQVHQRF